MPKTIFITAYTEKMSRERGWIYGDSAEESRSVAGQDGDVVGKTYAIKLPDDAWDAPEVIEIEAKEVKPDES
jgi:hypothetical protein